MKILLAVDGSPASVRAARHAARLAKAMAEPPALVVFHADAPLPRIAALELGVQGTADYHADNADHALRAVRTALRRARVEFTEKVVVAEPATAIVRHARAARVDLVVMGTRGRGAIEGLLLGSVARKVVAGAGVPVTVVP